MNELVATLVPAIGHALLRFTWQGLAIGLQGGVGVLHGGRAQLPEGAQQVEFGGGGFAGVVGHGSARYAS